MVAVRDRAHPLDALGPLTAPLSAVKVLFLGENTHYEGATHEAKGALVRALHTNHGFDTLLFEGDVISCELALLDGRTGSALVRACGVETWHAADSMQPLLQWLEGEGSRLRMGAFDCQPNGPLTRTRLLPALKLALDQTAPEFRASEDWDFLRSLIKRLIHWDFVAETQRRWPTLAPSEQLAHLPEVRPSSADRARFFAALTSVDGALQSHPDSPRWARITTCLQAQARQVWDDAPTPQRIHALRDAQMAENLLTIGNTHKVMAWGTTQSALTGASARGTEIAPWTTTGDLLRSALGAGYYVLGSAALGGALGPEQGPYLLEAPIPGSLEDQVSASGVAPVWVHLRGAPDGSFLDGRFSARVLGADKTLVWSEVVDGIVVVPEQRPIRLAP